MIRRFADFTNENVINLSKIRKWKMTNNHSDMYFIYELPKSELGKYLNTWFEGLVTLSKSKDFTINDEMITLKRVDKDTSYRLYHKEYNPVSINIHCPIGGKFKLDENGNKFYQMKAKICSVDDSQFGIWWDDKYTLGELKDIRTKLMNWVNTKPILNGDEFLDYCVVLGADENSKDYN